jgi:hypothetical protein
VARPAEDLDGRAGFELSRRLPSLGLSDLLQEGKLFWNKPGYIPQLRSNSFSALANKATEAPIVEEISVNKCDLQFRIVDVGQIVARVLGTLIPVNVLWQYPKVGDIFNFLWAEAFFLENGSRENVVKLWLVRG